MTSDPSGCTCHDETVRRCPVHSDPPAPGATVEALRARWTELDDNRGRMNAKDDMYRLAADAIAAFDAERQRADGQLIDAAGGETRTLIQRLIREKSTAEQRADALEVEVTNLGLDLCLEKQRGDANARAFEEMETQRDAAEQRAAEAERTLAETQAERNARARDVMHLQAQLREMRQFVRHTHDCMLARDHALMHNNPVTPLPCICGVNELLDAAPTEALARVEGDVWKRAFEEAIMLVAMHEPADEDYERTLVAKLRALAATGLSKGSKE